MRGRAAALLTTVTVAVALTTALTSGVANAGSTGTAGVDFTPGAPGAGDPYYPLDGNGGYDVRHYRLDVTYDPATDQLTGKATIDARATQNLSSFNLDLEGLTVRSVEVDDLGAAWSRDAHELTVTPRQGLRSGRDFTATIRYDGVPGGDVLHTDDGALVLGEPHIAASWFPANDHPSDKASYTVVATVPQGTTAVSNGTLESRQTNRAWTTFRWEAGEPMASYLATLAIGRFDLHAYQRDGLRYWDAIDSRLFDPVAQPRTGQRLALSGVASSTYKRLARTISVPAAGAQLSFWMNRGTEQKWDFVFVEAHTPGQDDWTTLRDLNGHTAQDTGFSCPFWLSLHPFLTHYQTDNGDGTCSPDCITGQWWAATGSSGGYEQWSVDLSGYASRDVEVSISYASDDIVQGRGVYVDDIEVSTGQGSTSFEDDGDVMDGWTVPGAPAGSQPNANDWFAGTASDGPPPPSAGVQASFARQPEIIGFLSDTFGPYPFSAAGGIVDDVEAIGALENQTRPVYSPGFFANQQLGDTVVVHELAHQWYGDNLTVARWQHIWLNEGFARYAEWLWSEREGLGTAQELFDLEYHVFWPADSPFWQTIVGDPGPERLFFPAIYERGAMTLHMLRRTVGDEGFFRILREYARTFAGGNVTTDDFIAVAERVSGRQLDGLFQEWLFTPGRPALPAGVAAERAPAQVPLVAKLGLSRAGG